MVYSPSPEQIYIGKRTQHEAPITRAEEDLWLRIGRKYAAARPDENDFLGAAGYRREDIVNDRSKLRNKATRRGFKEAHERAGLLEALLWWNIEQQNWLGENIRTVATAKADDELRGFDMILEAVAPEGEKEAVYRLGLDVALTDRPDEVLKKWSEILFWMQKARTDDSAMTVRYFQSEAEPGFRQPVVLPRVIVGIDKAHYEDLVREMTSGEQTKLILHPMRLLVAAEIRMQLARLLQSPAVPREIFEKNIRGILKALGASRSDESREPLPEWVKSDTVFRTLQTANPRAVSGMKVRDGRQSRRDGNAGQLKRPGGVMRF